MIDKTKILLYNCNRGTKFRLLDTKFPPDYPTELVEELKKKVWTLRKIDGMYSMCYDEEGIYIIL